ncbi:uncharacterized protein [Nicotiana tomentosiformis]|uniref:uncharacterized protein n=1 Tax=Nicotiana tomentosiformis TaxID=4098 RepID=UPI00388C94FF
MRTVGRQYTWTINHIYSRINRAIVNVEWMSTMPNLEVVVLDPLFSDHSPLCITFEDQGERRTRPFQFLNHLTLHSDLLNRVERRWRKPVNGGYLKGVWQELKNVKHEMKNLNREEYAAADRRINTIRSSLEEVQEIMRNPSHEPNLLDREKTLKTCLEK